MTFPEDQFSEPPPVPDVFDGSDIGIRMNCLSLAVNVCGHSDTDTVLKMATSFFKFVKDSK